MQNTIKKIIQRESYISIFFVKNKDLLERIKHKIIKKTKDSPLNYKTNVKAKFTGFYSLVEEPEIFEFITEIKPCIDNISNQVTIVKECWGNVYENDDHTILHHHREVSGFCGIIYLTEGGPGTYFKDFDLTIKEEYGKVVLFDPLLLHQVNKSNLQSTRITMVFNCYEHKPWDNLYLN